MARKPPDRLVAEAQAAETKARDAASAMKVQRDDHLKRAQKLEVQNRLLMRHQRDMRDWLTDAVQQWESARDTDAAPTVADKIHRRAVEVLAEADRYAQ